MDTITTNLAQPLKKSKTEFCETVFNVSIYDVKYRKILWLNLLEQFNNFSELFSFANVCKETMKIVHANKGQWVRIAALLGWKYKIRPGQNHHLVGIKRRLKGECWCWGCGGRLTTAFETSANKGFAPRLGNTSEMCEYIMKLQKGSYSLWTGGVGVKCFDCFKSSLPIDAVEYIADEYIDPNLENLGLLIQKHWNNRGFLENLSKMIKDCKSDFFVHWVQAYKGIFLIVKLFKY